MDPIIHPLRLAVKALVFLSIFSAACSVVPPQQEHYMLRSEYYRGLEEARRLSEAEKAALRERIVGVQSELAREEGRRIQVENDAEVLRDRLRDTEKRMDELAAAGSRDAAAARAEADQMVVTIKRLEEELETTRTAVRRLEREMASAAAERETTAVVIEDVLFAVRSRDLTREQRNRLTALSARLTSASHLSIVGHADLREANAWTLSAQRAAAVAEYLQNTIKVPSVRLTVVGRGCEAADRSIDAARNRRVEIIAIDR